jgi:predicted permease
MPAGLRTLFSRTAAVFGRGRDDRDFDLEVESHMSMLAERFVRQGMTLEEAKYAARKQFGGLAKVKQHRRESRSFVWLETLLQDVSLSIRALLRMPSFTVTAVATIALGIGANAAIFSVANAVLLRPLRAPDPDRIVRFLNRYPEGTDDTANFPEFRVWRERTDLFEDVSAHRLDPVNLTGDNPEQIQIARASATFFHLFGAKTSVGRMFTDEEDRPGGDRVAVLSFSFWQRRFGRNAQALGKTVVLGSESYRIIGILEAGFDTEQFSPPPDLWVPFQIDPATSDKGSYTWVTGRLKPGITLATANAQLSSVALEYRRTYPALDPLQSFEVEPLLESMVYNTRKLLPLWTGAVSFVLLIACANVANLLMSRNAGRKREIAIRFTAGAGRGRIIRQLLTESVMLSLCGGVLGLGLGTLGIRALLAMYPDGNPLSIPRLGEGGSAVVLDWHMAGFAALVSLVAAVLFGILPALKASRVNLSATLQESGRASAGSRQTKVRSLLVVLQMALALILLSGAALMMKTYAGMLSVNPGFEARNVQTLQMSLTATRFERTADMSRLVRDGAARIKNLPGVDSASAACCIPFETVWQLPFIVERRPLDGPYHAFAGWTFASPDYFRVFKIPLLRGRLFTDDDSAGSPGVAIINETMAQRYWPGSDALQARLIIGRGMRPEYDKDPIRKIVGIVSDVRDQHLNVRPRPAMYVPIAQLPDGINLVNLRLLPLAWFVRMGAPSPSLMKAIEAELRGVSGGLPVARVRAMDQVKTRSIAPEQFQMLLVTSFGSCAVLLAALGLYGVMAYGVEQRTRELGIRLAMGATPVTIRNTVVGEGARLALAGIAIGAAGGLGLARLNLATLNIFAILTPWEPVMIAPPILLTAVALLAAWVPSVRATRIDPVTALRCE